MTQFRVSKYLKKCGVSAEMQGLIFFTCININRIDEETQRRIINLCIEIAQEDYQALYEFLTNPNINHHYIDIKYGVGEKVLYGYKREFYQRFKIGR